MGSIKLIVYKKNVSYRYPFNSSRTIIVVSQIYRKPIRHEMESFFYDLI